jgi:nucleoside-diphosphate-sugar epimerase
MKRVMITGGLGLIGRQATRCLVEAGSEVHTISRHMGVGRLGPRLYGHSLDLMNASAVSRVMAIVRPTHLLHLAWVTAHGKYWQAPENLDWVGATLHLVRAFAAAGGMRFVGAGTCAEYDWSDPSLSNGNCHEYDTPTSPQLLYGVAKDACRRIVESFAMSAGIQMAWGRVFLVFGADEDPRRFVKSIIMHLAAGERAPCTAGDQVRDFTSAEDVGAAFAALTFSDACGPVNIGSGEGRTLRDVAMTLGHLMQRTDLIGFGDYPTRSNEPGRLVADVRRLIFDVGFPGPPTLEVRLSECIKAIRKSP